MRDDDLEPAEDGADRGGLIDITGLSLADLDDADESRLAQTLRQVLGPEARDGEALSGGAQSTV